MCQAHSEHCLGTLLSLFHLLENLKIEVGINESMRADPFVKWDAWDVSWIVTQSSGISTRSLALAVPVCQPGDLGQVSDL